jgi:hypothetical protein
MWNFYFLLIYFFTKWQQKKVQKLQMTTIDTRRETNSSTINIVVETEREIQFLNKSKMKTEICSKKQTKQAHNI